MDVLLGVEHQLGARWSDVRVGGGYLDPGLLADQLPRWGPVPVLALDGAPPQPDDAVQVLAACAELGVVAVDLGRAPSALRAAVLELCTVVVLVARAEVRAAGRRTRGPDGHRGQRRCGVATGLRADLSGQPT